MKRKSLIIVDVQSSVKEFRKATDHLELPCIDIDAVLDCVVEAISCKAEALGELLELPKLLVANELLGSHRESGSPYMRFDDYFSFHEQPDENVIGMDHITSMAQRMGQQLQQHFEAYKLYQNGELGYEFDGIVDEHAIALRARPRR